MLSIGKERDVIKQVRDTGSQIPSYSERPRTELDISIKVCGKYQKLGKRKPSGTDGSFFREKKTLICPSNKLNKGRLFPL